MGQYTNLAGRGAAEAAPGAPVAITAQPARFSDLASRIIPGVRKIAVLRANGIGDFIFTLPALEALQNAYPQAEVVLLGLPWHVDFLRGRPGPVHRVEVVPPIHGIYQWEVEEDPDEIERFFTAMAGEHFDLALQLHGGGRHSNRFLRRLGAQVTAGAKTKDALPLDLWLPYNYFQLEILRYLEIVSLVGAAPVTLQPILQVTTADLAEAEAAIPDDGHPLVAIHLGAGDPQRRWPVEKFATVGDALARQGARVAVIGTQRECDLVEALIDRMARPVENLCDRLTLGGLAGLFTRCALLISNDSGPLHVARAAGVATVGIYWCGNMITAGPETTARQRTAISWRLNCPQCGSSIIAEPCDHPVSFVADVPVQEVLAASQELLNHSGLAGSRLRSEGD